MEKKLEQKTVVPELRHQKQVSLQVLLPIIAAGVICLVVCLALVISTAAKPLSTEQWAQIATMFLILPTVFLGLIGLAILILLAIVIGKWNKIWPAPLRNFRLVILHIETIIQGFVQKPAQFVIAIRSTFTGFLALFKKQR